MAHTHSTLLQSMLQHCRDGLQLQVAVTAYWFASDTDTNTHFSRDREVVRHIQIKSDGVRFGLAEPLAFATLEVGCASVLGQFEQG